MARRPAPAGTSTSAGQPHTARPDPLIEQLAEEEAAKRGITRTAIASDEIMARITTAFANEGACVLEEGFATRASDIDVVYCYGYGFPRYRGGPMFYADTVGLPIVLARVPGVPVPLRRLLEGGAASRTFCRGF